MHVAITGDALDSTPPHNSTPGNNILSSQAVITGLCFLPCYAAHTGMIYDAVSDYFFISNLFRLTGFPTEETAPYDCNPSFVLRHTKGTL